MLNRRSTPKRIHAHSFCSIPASNHGGVEIWATIFNQNMHQDLIDKILKKKWLSHQQIERIMSSPDLSTPRIKLAALIQELQTKGKSVHSIEKLMPSVILMGARKSFATTEEQNANLNAVGEVLASRFRISPDRTDLELQWKIGSSYDDEVNTSPQKDKGPLKQPAEKQISINDQLITAYTQMYELAHQHPKTKITYTFYENDESRRQRLLEFFLKHGDFIPKNTVLQMPFYDGVYYSVENPAALKALTPKGIQGTGSIHGHFAQTITVIRSVFSNPKLPDKTHARLFQSQQFIQRALSDDDELKPTLLSYYRVGAQDSDKLSNLHFNLKIREQRARSFLKILETQINAVGNLDVELNCGSQHESFMSALQTLHDDLLADIQLKLKNDVPTEKIAASITMKIAEETSAMLNGILTKPTQTERLECIHTYEKNCKPMSKWSGFFKAVATVAIAALGFVVGAGIGIAAGVALGVWATPVTAVMGGFLGAKVALLAGAGISGITGGTIGGLLLFKPNHISKDVSSVTHTARNLVNGQDKPDDDLQLEILPTQERNGKNPAA